MADKKKTPSNDILHDLLFTKYGVLKCGATFGLLIFFFNWVIFQTRAVEFVGFALIAIALTWRCFKWWVYRGTINMGKKRPMKNRRTSYTSQFITNH